MKVVARGVFASLSPAGPRARLSVLIFHRVHASRDPLFPGEPDARRFETLIGWVRNWFNVFGLAEAVDRLREGTLPGRAAAITFDDGYADNYHVAMPILRRMNLPATFFIATGFLGGGRMWNDTVIEAIRRTEATEIDLGSIGLGHLRVGSLEEKRAAIEQSVNAAKYLPLAERDDFVAAIEESCRARLPDDLMMTRAEVVGLRDAGMEIGAHTRTHPILAQCSPAVAKREIGDGRDDLAGLLGPAPRLFAYPNGKPGRDYTGDHVRMVARLGFDAAFSTSRGAAGSGADLFQIPRYTPWAAQNWRFGLQLAQTLASTQFAVA